MSVGTDPLLGTDLAGYRLESVIGRGGMGVVYLAIDLRLERKVALKLVAPELAADPRFRERFLRESRLAASLDHSHVVPVHAAGETDGQLWLAMRYVEGEDLGTLLAREGRLEPARAVDLLGQVGEALDTAHEHGLVHRDVKPANVLVTREGGGEHCYLADFGLARNPGELQKPSPTHLSGTVDYTAPEQIAAGSTDGRADVYSLGCVFYECLAGEPPFTRPRVAATLFAHASEPPPSLRQRRPELPQAIDPVVATALAKEPGQRYRECRELTEAAREALGLGERRLTRRRLLVVGASAVLAVAASTTVPVILLGSGGDTAAATPPAPILPVTQDSLVRLDPGSGEALAAIATGSRPVGVSVGAGAVWVISQGDRRLVQIDPQTNEIVSMVSLPPGESPEGIVADAGGVWIRDAFGLHKYEPATNLFRTIGRRESLFFTSDISAGHGSVWVCDYGQLLRLDPATGRIIARRPLRGEPVRLAIDEDAVWLADSDGLLARVRPTTNALTPWTEVSDALDGIAAGEGALWALNSAEDLVLRIDPATLEVTDGVRVGRSPTALAAGEGAVWITSERDGTLTRIDPVTLDVKPIALGGAAIDLAVGDDALWVTVDVHRA